MNDWKPISSGYLAAFLTIGFVSIGSAVGFMIAGSPPTLTICLAACGVTAFGYALKRLAPPPTVEEYDDEN